MGVDDNQHSYLDKFRQVVTEMGNALGYVRLMRAGSPEPQKPEAGRRVIHVYSVMYDSGSVPE